MKLSWASPRMELAALCALAGFSVPAAQGQVRAWLDFDGGIPGESTDKAHAGWIEIQAFEIDGENRQITQDGFSVVKKLDRASPKLFLGCVKGTVYPKATLDLHREDSTSSGMQVARLEMESVSVVAQETTSSDVAVETVGLAFREITYIYFPATGNAVYSNYDYEQQSGSSGTGTGPQPDPDPDPDPDTDNDGMPDDWERLYQLSVGTNDADEDADGDGLSNLDEFRFGTHPQSGSSFFKARVSILPGAPQTCRVAWNSVVGKNYVVEWSPDLTTAFSEIRTVTATAAESTVDVPRPETIGFFRVRLE